MSSVSGSSASYTRSTDYEHSHDQRALWLGIRQALIIALGTIEQYLGLEQSITPKRKREG